MRNLALIFLCILLSCTIYPQIILLEENFEGSSSLPPGWSEINSVSWNHWLVSPVNNSHYLIITNHTSYASLNEGDEDKIYNAEYLLTPTLNLTNYSSAFMKFDIFFKSMSYQNLTEQASIEATLDGGINWSTIKSLDGFENWHTVYADISQVCSNQSVNIALKYSDNNGWLYGIAIDNVNVYIPFGNDGSIQKIKKHDYVPLNDTIFIEGIVQNAGSEIINSFNINWCVNEGETNSYSYNSTNLTPLDTISFLHPIPWIPDTQGPFDIKAWISDVNGVPDENPMNDTISIYTINAVTSIPDKKVLLEAFEANWCSICPHGASKIAEINDSTDNLLIAVIHIDDVFSTNAGTEIFNNYHLYPGWLVSGLIDRYDYSHQVSIDMDRYLWPTYVYSRENEISPVELSMNNTFNPNTKELDVILSATFMCDLTGDFRFNCYIVEDSLVEEQSNYLTISDREPFCYNENWIYDPPGFIQNYIHMNVLREVLGGTWGSEGSIPEVIVAGTQYDFQYEYTLANDLNENNIKIIGVVQQYNADSSKCEILNANSMYLDITSSAKAHLEDESEFYVYPNPAKDQLFIETRSLQDHPMLEIRNYEGKEILRKEMRDMKLTIDISTYPPGIYLISIYYSKRLYSKKIVFQ